jgi:hypothetical protein
MTDAPDLAELALALQPAAAALEGPQGGLGDAERAFVEAVTFAGAEDILTALEAALDADWGAFPVWARNLCSRLAVLQRPHDAALHRRAGADLRCFGPDWDAAASALLRRAEELDSGDR